MGVFVILVLIVMLVDDILDIYNYLMKKNDVV